MENIFQQTLGVSIEIIKISLPIFFSKCQTNANYRNTENAYIYRNESMVYYKEATCKKNINPLTWKLKPFVSRKLNKRLASHLPTSNKVTPLPAIVKLTVCLIKKLCVSPENPSKVRFFLWKIPMFTIWPKISSKVT